MSYQVKMPSQIAKPLDTCSKSESESKQANQSGMEEDSRYKGRGSSSIVPDPGRLLQHNDEANDMDEVVYKWNYVETSWQFTI